MSEDKDRTHRVGWLMRPAIPVSSRFTWKILPHWIKGKTGQGWLLSWISSLHVLPHSYACTPMCTHTQTHTPKSMQKTCIHKGIQTHIHTYEQNQKGKLMILFLYFYWSNRAFSLLIQFLQCLQPLKTTHTHIKRHNQNRCRWENTKELFLNEPMILGVTWLDLWSLFTLLTHYLNFYKNVICTSIRTTTVT